MVSTDNPYTRMQLEHYNAIAEDMNETNHLQHNTNSDYWSLLLPPKGTGKALDVGCGCGRSVSHLIKRGYDASGCDISPNIISYAKNRIPQATFYVVNGVELDGVPSNTFDYVISTIALQHIAVYDIRFSILTDILRVLKKGGQLRFQMAFGGHNTTVQYHVNAYDARGTNGGLDVAITDPKQITNDLDKIGFTDISYTLSKSYYDDAPQWIYVLCKK